MTRRALAEEAFSEDFVSRGQSPSEVYEISRRRPRDYRNLARRVVHRAGSVVILDEASIINADITGVCTFQGAFTWQGDISAPAIISKKSEHSPTWVPAEPAYWDFSHYSPKTFQKAPARGPLRDFAKGRLQLSNDPPFSVHAEIRPSNIVFHAETATPVVPIKELSPTERRYKELNKKHYAGTITGAEQVELTQIEESLDAADRADPELIEMKAKVTEGYDRLQTGLTQIHRILDELLKG